MRVSAVLFAVALAACASTPGASNQPPPFTREGQATPVQPADHPIAVDLPAGTYRMDPRHASVSFRIRHMGLAWFTARFDGRAATLEFDPADPSRSTLRATVDAGSVNTGVLNQQGERAFDRSIARALGLETTPTISFASTAIERTGEHSARVTGDLTMNGQTHPATLEVTFDGGAVDPLRGNNMVLGFSAHGEIDRTQWGVDEWRSFTGAEVQIVIEAELIKA
jgi:polyisoprenoid-binding protein YceI